VLEGFRWVPAAGGPDSAPLLLLQIGDLLGEALALSLQIRDEAMEVYSLILILGDPLVALCEGDHRERADRGGCYSILAVHGNHKKNVVCNRIHFDRLVVGL